MFLQNIMILNSACKPYSLHLKLMQYGFGAPGKKDKMFLNGELLTADAEEAPAWWKNC